MAALEELSDELDGARSARPAADASSGAPRSSTSPTVGCGHDRAGAPPSPAWLAELRVDAEPGPHVAYYDDEGEGALLISLKEGWTRVGRTAAADVRLDDPSVSRRHALIVRTHSGGLRALDDRSLNGLFVNGQRVEWTKLADGDELEIGRFRLHVLVVD